VLVKVINIDPSGKIRLSKKALIEPPEGVAVPSGEGGPGGGERPRREGRHEGRHDRGRHEGGRRDGYRGGDRDRGGGRGQSHEQPRNEPVPAERGSAHQERAVGDLPDSEDNRGNE
jgi:hypothetical protein